MIARKYSNYPPKKDGVAISKTKKKLLNVCKSLNNERQWHKQISCISPNQYYVLFLPIVKC